MSLLELIFIFVLQFEAGISGKPTFLFSTPGHHVTLSCATASPSDTCSLVTWLYNRERSPTFVKVRGGNVMKDSARAARLSLDTRCSLVINNITAEDVGLYTCRQGETADQDADVYLSVLTISPSPPDADPKRDGEVTLECSLFRYTELGPCQQNRIHWVDETGTVLDGEGVGYEFLGQTNCVSRLSVKRQSGHNRRYTCQWVNNQNNVQIQADYTPVFSDDQPDKPDSGHILAQTHIIIIAVVGVVLVLVVIAALFIKYRKRDKVTAVPDVPKPTQEPDEPDSNLVYITVSHTNQQASPERVKKEEGVTYSTIKALVKIEEDNDPSSLYSNVSTAK